MPATSPLKATVTCRRVRRRIDDRPRLRRRPATRSRDSRSTHSGSHDIWLLRLQAQQATPVTPNNSITKRLMARSPSLISAHPSGLIACRCDIRTDAPLLHFWLQRSWGVAAPSWLGAAPTPRMPRGQYLPRRRSGQWVAWSPRCGTAAAMHKPPRSKGRIAAGLRGHLRRSTIPSARSYSTRSAPWTLPPRAHDHAYRKARSPMPSSVFAPAARRRGILVGEADGRRMSGPGRTLRGGGAMWASCAWAPTACCAVQSLNPRGFGASAAERIEAK